MRPLHQVLSQGQSSPLPHQPLDDLARLSDPAALLVVKWFPQLPDLQSWFSDQAQSMDLGTLLSGLSNSDFSAWVNRWEL